MARFQFFSLTDRQTYVQTTDRQNRLLNPASRMRARSKNSYMKLKDITHGLNLAVVALKQVS